MVISGVKSGSTWWCLCGAYCRYSEKKSIINKQETCGDVHPSPSLFPLHRNKCRDSLTFTHDMTCSQHNGRTILCHPQSATETPAFHCFFLSLPSRYYPAPRLFSPPLTLCPAAARPRGPSRELCWSRTTTTLAACPSFSDLAYCCIVSLERKSAVRFGRKNASIGGLAATLAYGRVCNVMLGASHQRQRLKS